MNYWSKLVYVLFRTSQIVSRLGEITIPFNSLTHISGPLLDENSQWNIKIVFFPVRLLFGCSINSLKMSSFV